MTLNPKEAPRGYRAELGLGDLHDCRVCAMRFGCSKAPGCAATERQDGCNVYFVKLPKKPKRTKPKRKAHVVWVGSYTDAHMRWMPFVAVTRANARRDKRFLAQFKHKVRGPVKVVLP